MPITSIGSYLVEGEKFVQHWTLVNQTLAPATLTLPVAYGITQFQADIATLQTAIQNVTLQVSLNQQASSVRDMRKVAINKRIIEFRAALESLLPSTGLANTVPRTPNPSDNESRTLTPYDDIAGIWSIANALSGVAGFTPPLLLSGGFTLANMQTAIASLRTAYKSVNDADVTVRMARNSRDMLLPLLKGRMLAYRKAVIARFGPDSPQALSLPVIAPKPGTTPTPVPLSGVWDVSGSAKLVFTLSPDPRVVNYDVRACFGSRYLAKDEQTVESSIDPDGGHYFTTYGLAVAGASVWFKVYVITNEGNEAGSNAVKITHPM